MNTPLKKLMAGIVFSTVAMIATPAFANLSQETVIHMHSIKDNSIVVDDALCDQAPFPTNVRQASTLWSFKTHKKNGVVKDEASKFVGVVRACGLLTDPTLVAPIQMLMSFELNDGTYTGVGTCYSSSNDIPVPGVALGGCVLNLNDVPAGYMGGNAIANNMFITFGDPQVESGGWWILRLFSA